jgi:probable O-glycosylation ligase (exosortase A-associated)
MPARERTSDRTQDRAEQGTRYLYWWLLASLFLEYARPLNFVPALEFLPLNSVVPLALLITTFFTKELRPANEFMADPLSKWLLAFFGAIFFSVAYATVTLYAFTVMTTVLGYLILWLVLVRIVTTTERVRGVFGTLIVAHLFLIVMNPAAILNPEQRNYIVGGTFLGDGNDFALSLCILLPMAVELAAAAKSNMKRILWLLALLTLVLAIIGSSSRGGTLGMAAVAVYLWLRSPRKGLAFAAMLVGIVVLLIYAPEKYFTRMNKIVNYEEDGSAMGRIEAWHSGLLMYADNPVLGVGAGNFPNSYGSKYRPPGSAGGRWHNAHSMYFQVLGELATVGITILLMVLLSNIRTNTRLRRALEIRHRGQAPPPRDNELGRMLYLQNASMLGFIVAGAFLSVAYYPHIFVLTALMTAVRCIVRKETGVVDRVKAGPRPGMRATLKGAAPPPAK